MSLGGLITTDDALLLLVGYCQLLLDVITAILLMVRLLLIIRKEVFSRVLLLSREGKMVIAYYSAIVYEVQGLFVVLNLNFLAVQL